MPANGQEKYLSRYIDEDNSALFPFGWGLSYTRFSYSQPVVDKAQVSLQDVAEAPRDWTQGRRGRAQYGQRGGD
jgi:beta-glucosidase